MIHISATISLAVQLVIGIIDYLALHVKVDPKEELLKDLLKIELIVQIVEFVFYVWLFYYFSKVSRNITPYRYLDWSITTPLMLITLSGFLQHDGSKTTRLADFLYDNSASILKIVGLNAAMLFCGLLGEFGYLSPYVSTTIGFIPFALNFNHIKERFLPPEDKLKNFLFYWFVFFWALYGVFAVMNYTTKNTGYNILDIFAKNFFGLFLAHIIWSKSQSKYVISNTRV